MRPYATGGQALPVGIEERDEPVLIVLLQQAAMFAWYKTELEPKRHKAAKSYVRGLEDVTKVPLISHAELENILVPRYIKVSAAG